MLPGPVAPAPAAVAAVEAGLSECLESGEDGKIRLAVTLPDADAVDGLATALARLVAAGQNRLAAPAMPGNMLEVSHERHTG